MLSLSAFSLWVIIIVPLRFKLPCLQTEGQFVVQLPGSLRFCLPLLQVLVPAEPVRRRAVRPWASSSLCVDAVPSNLGLPLALARKRKSWLC